MARRKSEAAPAAWEKLHTVSATRLLRVEGQSLFALRSEARSVHLELLGTIQSAGSRTGSLTALKDARTVMAETVAKQVKATRRRAREAAILQAQAELDQLATELRKLGYISTDRKFDAGQVTDHEADDAAADMVGHSLASAWAQAVLVFIINATQDEDVDVARQARSVMIRLESRLARIAATESAKAYSDQHEDASSDPTQWDVEPQDDESDRVWLAWLFRHWNAVLDQRTCQICRDHDNEIVPLGMSFEGGDEPGDEHVLCRCIDSMIFLPIPLPKGDEDSAEGEPEIPTDDEVEAA